MQKASKIYADEPTILAFLDQLFNRWNDLWIWQHGKAISTTIHWLEQTKSGMNDLYVGSVLNSSTDNVIAPKVIDQWPMGNERYITLGTMYNHSRNAHSLRAWDNIQIAFRSRGNGWMTQQVEKDRTKQDLLVHLALFQSSSRLRV
jgi:hypothetical protein